MEGIYTLVNSCNMSRCAEVVVFGIEVRTTVCVCVCVCVHVCVCVGGGGSCSCVGVLFMHTTMFKYLTIRTYFSTSRIIIPVLFFLAA